MADLKPLGSEKLKGDEKLKRILELTYYKDQNNEGVKYVKADYICESSNGVYGIVKERDAYYVKKGLTEETLDYIGGMFMKNKNKFSSYAEAFKRLDLLKGQENLQEGTKYVLKQNAPAPAPMPEPAPEATAPAPDLSGADSAPTPEPAPEGDLGEPTPDETGEFGTEDGEMGDEGDYLKNIQKLTGKLGQKLRLYNEKMESDDVKYVINSVLSALDLEKLDETDKEEILDKFENEEDFGGADNPNEELPDDGSGDEGNLDLPIDTQPETEVGEMDTLEELINTPLTDGEDETEDNGEQLGRLYQSIDDVELSEDDEDEEDIPVSDDSEDEDEGDTCPSCHGSGVTKYGRDCPTCNGEGKVYNTNKVPDEDLSFLWKDDDDEDFDPGYTEDMRENNVEPGVKEIDISELTELVNNTVKQTLGKYFN